MANKFNVFVYNVGEKYGGYIDEGDDVNYFIDVDFVDMDGNITPCRIEHLDFEHYSDEVLYIIDFGKEGPRVFKEQLLEADEFYIEFRCKAKCLGDIFAVKYFTQTLRCMSRIYDLRFGTIIECNLRDTPRNVESREASQEYWEELEMKKLLGKLWKVSSEIETLCGESHVKQINLEGGQVDVSEVLTYLETMRANIFDKLSLLKKQQAVA